jgi:NADPH:quinone reductase-like Zn-dependent oxidoreductase
VFPYYAFANKGANLRVIQGFCIPKEARQAGESFLAQLATEGRLSVAIAASYPLSDIASAHEHVERGSIGNVVVTL